jgi:ATP-dependent Clp protease protease subunit
MNVILADHTGRPVDDIARDTERDYYMSGDEAQEYGLIDRVVRDRNEKGQGNGKANGGGSDK